MHKIIVSQIGARHRYLIPQILNNANILSYLYTDSCKYSLLGKTGYFLKYLGIKYNKITRLINRDPKIPKTKVLSTDKLFFKCLINRSNAFNKINTLYQGMSKVFINSNLDDCDIIYNMYFENIDFLKYGKKQGKIIISDIYENPTAFINLIDEINNTPEYCKYESIKKWYYAESVIREKYMNELLKIADFYTIPSIFVLESLKKYANFDINKSQIIPYPSSIINKEYNYNPQKHKLIWVGNDPIRKGLIYCAKAATILKEKYKDLSFEIIGVKDNELIKNKVFKDLTFIGTLNKEELIERYRTAEAYVFPTLYEGLAGTIIEAGCCGCPIITTENSGVDKSKFPAIYIPTRNIDAIVKAVEEIFESTQKRDKLSKNVFEFANKEYSPSTYEKNLLEFIEAI